MDLNVSWDLCITNENRVLIKIIYFLKRQKKYNINLYD